MKYKKTIKSLLKKIREETYWNPDDIQQLAVAVATLTHAWRERKSK